jgi:hypothetical protein
LQRQIAAPRPDVPALGASWRHRLARCHFDNERMGPNRTRTGDLLGAIKAISSAQLLSTFPNALSRCLSGQGSLSSVDQWVELPFTCNGGGTNMFPIGQ